MLRTRFRDRAEAGRALGDELSRQGFHRPLVLGIPRGGVVVASSAAKVIGAELGVVVARKLGAPGQPELALGAVTADGATYVNEALAREVGADAEYVALEVRRQAAEALRREAEFGSYRTRDVVGREVIIVDDGLATGATAIAAVRSLKSAEAGRVILAVPVGPPETLADVAAEADEVVCLVREPLFFGVGQFYVDFHPVEDAEVRAALEARTDEDPEDPAGLRPASR